MAYVKADLTREVLGELFSLASGQTPNSEDTTWVEQRIDSTLAALAKLNIIYLSDADEIPDEPFNALAAYMAEICGPKFGKPRDPVAKKAAEDELRAIQRMGSGSGAMLRVDRGLTSRRRVNSI